MATKTPKRTKPRTPRVMVTLSPEARFLLDKMAKATRTPKAALVAELVDAGLPAMAITLDAIELVKAGKNHEAERLLGRFALQATSQLSQQQLELQEENDARTVKGKRAKKGASGRTAT
jgi:predicted DNA-binding protein